MAEHVGSGEFRIDRDRALEALARFRIRDPADHLLPFLRCAVAAGASRIALSRVGMSGFRIEFDGVPFTAEELARVPAAALEPEARPSLRQLALGTLSLPADLYPNSFRLESASADTAASLQVSGKEYRVAPGDRPLHGTRITIVYGGMTMSLAGRRAVARAAEVCALSPVPVSLDGEPLSRVTELELPRKRLFGGGALRGWVAEPSSNRPSSRVELYHYGIRVGAVELETAVPVEGAVNNDGFTLDASQGAVVVGAARESALAAIEAEIPLLVSERVREVSAGLEQYGKLLDDATYYGLWLVRRERWDGELLGRPRHVLMRFTGTLREAQLGGSGRRDVESIDRLGHLCSWLRSSVRRVVRAEPEPGDALASLLWEAPVYLGASGRQISLKRIAAGWRRTGRLELVSRGMSWSSVFLRSPRCTGIEELARRLDGPAGDCVGPAHFL